MQNLFATLKRGINVRSIDVLLTAFMQYVKSKAEYLLNHIAVYAVNAVYACDNDLISLFVED